MSVTRPHRELKRAAAARLLRGGPPADVSESRLAAMLAAASVSRPSDVDGREALAREHIAMAAFRVAVRSPVPAPRRPAVLRSTLAKAVTVKATAVAVAVLGLGGVALATTGNLPGSSHAGATHASNPPASHRPQPVQQASAAPSDKVPPGLWWLCHDYIGRDPGQRSKALGDPSFKDLVEGAGNDRDTVDAFCAKLLQRGPDGQPSALPTGGSTTHPGEGPKPHLTPSHPAGGRASSPGQR